jgi:hypothetical protein
MSDRYCVFILTNRRPDRQHTYETLIKSGYTGDVYFVVDDHDPTRDAYRDKYGDKVIIFDLDWAKSITDDGDNFNKGTVLYARNACFKLADDLGYKYFIELDDDYKFFQYRYGDKLQTGYWSMRTTADQAFAALIRYFRSAPFTSLAIAQGGDFIGGVPEQLRLKRKAMNFFICATDRPFRFCARMNDDVTTYVSLGGQGYLFGTTCQIQLSQLPTQSNPGGLTELYLEAGTYVKSFYSVMWSPSCVKIGTLIDHAHEKSCPRIHHTINWERAVPKLISGRWRKVRD